MPTKQFNIIDQEDQRQLIKRLLKQLNLDEKLYPPRKLQGFINRKKEQGLRSAALKDETETNDPTLIHIYKVYEAQLQADQSLDFADLLLYTYELFKANERIRTAYQERFKMLLVDEFQDTNHLQYEWLKLLINDANTITAVGDDDQSIYGWRGANVEHVFEFQKDYAPVKIIKLEQNYRSTQNILNAANGLIAHNQKRMSKSLWSDRGTGEKINLYEASTEREEAHYLASCIQMNLANGYTADDMAILYRSNAQSRIIEETLLKYNIPYRIYGGVRFFERAEIKNALAYLRLVAFRDDNVAFERIINLPSRGIGQKTIEKIRTHARTYGMALFESAYEMVNKRILPAKSLKSVTSFLNLIDDLETRINNVDLAEKVRFTIEHSGLLAYYGSEKHDKARQRLENLKELVNAAYDFMPPIEKPNERHMLEEFLAFAVLESGEIQADKNTPAVHLMTIHAAKGLEFPFVYMVGLEENIFPTSQSIAENDIMPICVFSMESSLFSVNQDL
jgi:DNA helicase-2/ATP-dependent DNA helicase PcrA